MAKKDVFIVCSFCGKDQHHVAKLIAGPAVHICDECVALCNEILADGGPYDPAEIVQGRTIADMSDAELFGKIRNAGRVAQHFDAQVKATVNALRDRGVTWAQIGEAFGTTRQAAWERFADEA